MIEGTARLTAWAQGRTRLRALAAIVLLASTPFLDGFVAGRVYTGCASQVGSPATRSRDLVPRSADTGDACVQFEPWIAQALRAIRQGELPLWNPYQGLGAPLLGNMISALLWPLNVAYLLLPFHLALAAIKVARLAFTGIFTFLFLSRLGCRTAPATIGAIGFMWSSFNVLWLYHPQGNIAMVLPLLFWLIEETFARPGILAPIGLTAALGLGWLGGHPGTYVHALIAAGLYYAYKVWDVRDPRLRLRRAVQGGIAVVGGLSLAAAQLMPFAEYLVQSEAARRAGLVENPFLRPFHLPLLWVPDLLGNYPLAHREFDYGYFTKVRNYAEATTGYVGLTLLFLAIVAVCWRWADGRVRAFTGLSLFSLAAAFGMPGVRALFVSVPLLTQSHPNRGLFVHAFAVTVLATLALSDTGLRRDGDRPHRWGRALVVTLALVVTTSVLGVWLAWPRLDGHEVYLLYLRRLAKWTALDLLGLGIVVALRRSSAFLWCVAFVALAETAGHGWAMLHPLPREEHFPSPPVIRYLEENLDMHRFAVLSRDKLLAPDMATYYRLAQLEQYDALLVRGTVDAVRRHMSGILPHGTKELRTVGQVDADFLRLVGVRFVIARGWDDLGARVASPGTLGAAFTPAFESRRIVVFRGTDELPRAFVLPQAVEDVVRTSVAQLVASPRSDAVIERYGGTIVILRLVPFSSPGTLILSDAFYPGWRATVDGRPAPVHQVISANLRAVPVPPGAQMVMFHYAPWSVRMGLLMSGITLVALIGAAASALALRKHEGNRSSPDAPSS